jgi:hypothetical protein
MEASPAASVESTAASAGSTAANRGRKLRQTGLSVLKEE